MGKIINEVLIKHDGELGGEERSRKTMKDSVLQAQKAPMRRNGCMYAKEQDIVQVKVVDE